MRPKPNMHKKYLILGIILILVISIIGTLMVNNMKKPVVAEIDKSTTIHEKFNLSAIRCDGSDNNLTIPANYAIVLVEVPNAQKRDLLTINSTIKTSKLYELASNVRGDKYFNESITDIDGTSGSMSGRNPISDGSDVFLIGVSTTETSTSSENNALLEIIRERFTEYVYSVSYFNQLNNSANMIYTCKIE